MHNAPYVIKGNGVIRRPLMKPMAGTHVAQRTNSVTIAAIPSALPFSPLPAALLGPV